MRHAVAAPRSVDALALPMVCTTAFTTLVSLSGGPNASASGRLAAGRAAERLAVVTGITGREDPATLLRPTRPHPQQTPGQFMAASG